MKKFFLLIAFLGLQVLNATPPPVEHFFQNPTFRNFQISPNGDYLAGLIPYRGFMNIAVIKLETKETRVLTGQELDITWFTWANDSRILYSINQGEMTKAAFQNMGAFFGVNVDGTEHKPVLDSMFERGKKRGYKHKGMISFFNRLRTDPDHVLVFNSSRRSGYPDIYKMNINSGKLIRVSNNPGYITDYFVDPDGVVLGGIWWEDRDDPTTASIRRRDLTTDEWVPVMKVKSLLDIPEFLGSLSGSSEMLVSKKGEDGMKRLYSMSFNEGFSERIVLEDDVYDISNVIPLLNLKTKEIVGVSYNEDKPVNYLFDETYRALYDMINSAIPDSANYVYDVDDKGSKLLVYSFSDRKSPEYFYLDLKSKTMDSLGKLYPNLDGVYLPEHRPILYQARDGHQIHGYLYLPENYKDGDQVPLVINPHGGPWARDTWGVTSWLSLEPAFYTSRGFAFLRVNFRSSTGYGEKHQNAANKNWDVALEDIWDGVNWAIEEGYTNKEEIGIVGASFGGTATMLSLVHKPDMFQFGINFFGVVDLPEHIKTYYEWKRDFAGDMWKRLVGDPKNKNDAAKLEKWSAINYVDNIDDPVFLYHGVVDQQVDIEQTRALVKQLKRSGKKEGRDYEIVWDTDEGHGAYNAEKRIKLYKKIDEFLKPFAPAWNK